MIFTERLPMGDSSTLLYRACDNMWLSLHSKTDSSLGSASEAAFMTGLERNSDIVFAASYAPLLNVLCPHSLVKNFY